MLIRILIRVLATAAALLLISQIVPGVSVSGWYSAIVVAIIWGIMGLTIRPVLNLLTLPITLITFGLFSFIINALLFWLLSTVVEGFAVTGFLPALLGSLLLTVVAWILHRVL